MEDYTVLPEIIQAKYDDKRFPKIWHAVLGVAVMYVPIYTVLTLIMLATGGAYETFFNSEFGLDMFNGVISQFFAILSVPLFMLLVTKRDMGVTLRLKKNIDILQVLLLAIFSIGVFFLLQIINSMFMTSFSGFIGEPSESGSMVDATNLTQVMFQIVIVAGLPAICEEIFFRGFVMRAFERKSQIKAILMSAIIFAVMHGNFKQLVYAFLCGIILGTVVTLTDSLLAGCVVHFTLNAISVLFSYPPINDLYIHYASNYEYIFSSVIMLVLPVLAFGAMALFILYTLKKNKKKYGFSVPTDMSLTYIMQNETSGEKVIKTISWIAFILINVIFMFTSW